MTTDHEPDPVERASLSPDNDSPRRRKRSRARWTDVEARSRQKSRNDTDMEVLLRWAITTLLHFGCRGNPLSKECDCLRCQAQRVVNRRC